MATQNTLKTECRRCGVCCQKGGPALHRADRALLQDGLLPRRLLVTLRMGEPVFDNVAARLTQLAQEIVKIAGPTGLAPCPLHRQAETSACAIHERRPAECRALDCHDTAAIEALYRADRLRRADIVHTGGGLWQIITLHEERFPAGQAVLLARRAAGGDRDASAQLAVLTEGERDFRIAFAARFDPAPDHLDFLFGRSLAQIVAPLAPGA